MDVKELRAKIIECVKLLDGIFDEVSRTLAATLADEEMLRPNQLMPKRAFLERYQLQIAEELQKTKARMQNGPLVILELLSQEDVPDFSVIDEFAKLYDLATLIANEKELFIQKLKSGQTVQEIAKITDPALEKMYQAAKSLYEQRRFQEACDAFGFLTMLNAGSASFWTGLANSEFQLQNYEGALFAYAFVSRVNPDDIFCHILSCRAYEALGDFANAKNALEIALYVIGDAPDHEELKQNIKAKMQLLDMRLC